MGMIFLVQKLYICVFFITVNVSSFVKCDLLHKIEVISVTHLYGYQFANFSEI